MSADRPVTYIVSAYDTKDKAWKTVLATRDRDEAEAMKAAMEQDSVRARIEAFPATQR